MRTSIHDVAKRAGVSISTVSRVINHSANVNDKKAAAVKEAMAYYNYEPNQFGRGLVKQQTDMIGVYFPYTDFSLFDNAFYLELLRGMDRAIARENYSLLLINENPEAGHSEENPKFLQYIYQNRIDGLLLNGLSSKTAELAAFKQLVDEAFPMAYIGKRLTDTGFNVYAGFESYMYQMLEVFKSCGHRHVLVFLENRPRNLALFEALCNKFCEAFREMAVEVCAVEPKHMREQIEERLEQSVLGGSVSGVFAYDVESASCIYSFCQAYKLEVPKHLSVIGVEHKKDAGAALFPKLTSFFVPARDMGCRAAQMLLGYLKGESVSEVSVEFEPEYVLRDSVASLK